MRKYLMFAYIKALEWYLDMPSITQQTNTTQDFLANAWRHTGFREFAKKRVDTLIYEAAGGSGLAPTDRVKYIELVGRRLEVLNIAAMAKQSFELEEKRKRVDSK